MADQDAVNFIINSLRAQGLPIGSASGQTNMFDLYAAAPPTGGV